MTTDQFPPRFPDDQENPYAPPRADLGPEKAAYGTFSVRPEIGAVLSRAWEAYKERIWICVAAVLIYLLFWVAGQVLVGVLQAGMDQGGMQPGGPPPAPPNPSAAILYLVAVIGVTIFQQWITSGMILFLLRIARGQEASLGLIFAGGPYLLRLIGATILNGLIIFGVMLIGVIPGIIAMALSRQSPLGIIVFVVCLLGMAIVAIVISLRLSQYMYLIVDRDAGVVESLQTSYEITRGYVGTVFAVGFVAAAIGLAGLLGFGVGVLFTGPIGALMVIVLYLALVGNPAMGGKVEDLAELEPI
jgi:hypothetical protein